MGRRLLATTTASFDLIRHHCHNDRAFLYGFDLIELNGDDMRRDPLEVRKATLRSMLAKTGLGLRFNEHMEGDGPTVFAHACQDGARRHRVETEGPLSPSITCTAKPSASPQPQGLENLRASARDAPRCMSRRHALFERMSPPLVDKRQRA